MKFTSFTDKGGRAVNDDYFAEAGMGNIHIFAAADGMGQNGSAASSLAVKTIIEEFKVKPELSPAALKHYITRAQSAVLEIKAYNQEYDNIGAALAVLITDGKRAVYANCGDARIYIFRGARISEVTEDHSEAFEAFESGDIEYREIRLSPDRHKLRRAIGDRISWEPDISDVIGISSGYSFLICTDGFWNLITEEEMEKAKRFTSSSSTWLKRMMKKVTSRLRKSSDNYTAAAVCIQKMDTL
ncbi:MAG: serine/threonine-protein phosphatase [bacterium]|nr:serine/threonine-protein phosphatase [bacterium]